MRYRFDGTWREINSSGGVGCGLQDESGEGPSEKKMLAALGDDAEHVPRLALQDQHAPLLPARPTEI